MYKTLVESVAENACSNEMRILVAQLILIQHFILEYDLKAYLIPLF